MNILITGAAGFVGKNLTENLKNIRDGKNRTRPDLTVGEIFEYDLDSDPALLDEACAKADFVFHLAGVNRPKDPKEFMEGNFGFTTTLLETLKKHRNTCPVMISSSIQATCIGRYDSDYGRSKKAGEECVFAYGEETGAKVLVYRFPNLFGKWCRPNYNSAVATFCNNIANDLAITVNDPAFQLPVGSLQYFLDRYLKEHPEAEVDYIHGEDSVRALAKNGAVGFLFAGMEKEDLFRTVLYDGSLPRKTFSMGHARDKRYYLEARAIR